MWLSRYFVYFSIFSCMGWIYESIYCTIRAKKWANRGFLYGPMCPIYGAGGVGITAIADIIEIHTTLTFEWWQIFLVAFFGSIILEYGTSWALEKMFHAYWWDYSDKPLNVNGRICLPYSIAFGVAGLLVVYIIAPFTKFMTSWMTPVLYEFFSLLFMGVISVDTAITVSALTDFSRTIIRMQTTFNSYMDGIVAEVQEKRREVEEKSEEKLAERTRSIRTSADTFLDSMGVVKKQALNRAKGFRNPKIDRKYMDAFTEGLKDKIKNRKK